VQEPVWAYFGVELRRIQLSWTGVVDLDTLGEAQDLPVRLSVVGKQPAFDRRLEVWSASRMNRLGARVRAECSRGPFGRRGNAEVFRAVHDVGKWPCGRACRACAL